MVELICQNASTYTATNLGAFLPEALYKIQADDASATPCYSPHRHLPAEDLTDASACVPSGWREDI